AHDGGPSLEQLHADVPGDEALIAQDKLEQVLMKGAEPQAVVNQVRVFLRHEGLESLRLLRQAQRLQLAMRLVQDHGGRRFVNLPRLDADEPILNVVDAADAMAATDLVKPFEQRDSVNLLAVDSDRPAFLELDLEVRRLARC